MKVSKDLSVTRDENGCVNIFSYSLGKNIIVTDVEILPLIEALLIEHAAQQSVEPTICPACGMSEHIESHARDCEFNV